MRTFSPIARFAISQTAPRRKWVPASGEKYNLAHRRRRQFACSDASGRKKMADQKLTEITQGMVNNEALRTGNIQPQ